ncbi:ATP-dependent helicase DinG [Weizmannia acidilactici]|uniref:3'-5' exonuclease DinG n=1 Tax=Weizmannia acidilactici TaxID=2607726 RepID=A0A5J4JNZ7_9BACI|nr:ATP-dependent DNA helicase DinG [Weizmannia acidilactici]GER70734.1 ATP-dependent helicase DinG [Weizmannia acidilactici]
MLQRYVVVDIETTGNSAKKGDRIIQFSVVVIEGREIKEQFTSFVNPGQPVPAFIGELTGIEDHMLEDAPLFLEIAPRIMKMLENSIFVAHNVLFDLPFLQQELKEAGLPPFRGFNMDTVEFSRIAFPTLESYKLADLAEALSLSHERPHRADSDALVTAKLFLACIERCASLPLVTLEKLAPLSYSLKSDLAYLFQEILEEKRRHADDLPPELEVFRGIALRRKKIVPPASGPRVIGSYPATVGEKEKLFQGAGSGFEMRPAQFDMMDHVRDALSSGRHVAVEAGTGVGKSLAYLLPAAYQAVASQKPVLISTYTVALEHQLLNKEIKSLERILNVPLRTVLLKGRSHYLHLFKFEQSLKEQDHQYDSVLAKMQILVWLTDTESGDVDELNLSGGGKKYWRRIKQGGWHTDKKDPWKTRDFYLHAKACAEQADIAVTNHAMLCGELGRDRSVFDVFQYVIVDEAHHLEQAAREMMGKRADYNQMKYMVSRIGLYEQKQLFYELEQLMEKYELHGRTHTFEAQSLLKALDAEIDDLFGMLARKVMRHKKDTSGYHKIKLRIKKENWKQKSWQAVLHCTERIRASLKDISQALTERLEQLLAGKSLTEEEQAFIEEMYSFLADWDALRDNMAIFIGQNENGGRSNVVWLEGDLRALPNSLVIHCQPVYAGEILRNKLFAKKKSVVLTSATLTVNGSFQYFFQEVGLSAKTAKTVRIPSPFRYDKQVQFIIPSDLPDISTVQLDDFAEKTAGYLLAVSEATKGRMMILFTSFDLLKKVYQLMKDSGMLEDYMLIAQGISSGSRSRMTKTFQKFDKAILFGLSSFWEGVDIPGDDLSCLVMVRLPFLPPDEPVTEAKCDYLRVQGKNPFSAYSLPEAVLRFKQGFGRLIRTKTDRGIFLVLDRRIETTTYGPAFTKSLPPVRIKKQTLNETLDTIENWL